MCIGAALKAVVPFPRMYTHIYVCIHTCIYIHTYTYTYVHRRCSQGRCAISARTHTRLKIAHTCNYAYTQSNANLEKVPQRLREEHAVREDGLNRQVLCMLCVHVCIYIYVYIYIHAYIRESERMG